MRACLAILAVLALPSSAHAALSLEPVGTFTAPIYATAPPGDASRLFVVERGGTIRVVKDGVTLSTPFLTIAPARATLATSLSTRRAIRRLLGRGPLHVDITASIAEPRATARRRLRAR